MDAQPLGDPSSSAIVRPSIGKRVLIAVLFELGLAAIALGIGRMIGFWPLVGVWTESGLQRETRAALWGMVASVPPLVGLWLAETGHWTGLRSVRDLARNLLMQWFPGASVSQLALVALAAGIGEEILFRGLVQHGLAAWIGPPWGMAIGLAVASLLFGVCHWLSTSYALLTFGAGVYLGLLLELTGSLWTPMVAHAVYDFVALIVLLHGPDPVR